jgi:hypothetical protein
MTRWKLTTWFASVAAVVALTACGSAAPDADAAPEEDVTEAPTEEPTEPPDEEPTEPPDEEPTEPPVAEESTEPPVAEESTEPPVAEGSTEPPAPGDPDGERDFGPLPPEDRPEPADPPECDTASPTPVPC